MRKIAAGCWLLAAGGVLDFGRRIEMMTIDRAS
jgi:hypothetical protein